jgi:hypothetical protein
MGPPEAVMSDNAFAHRKRRAFKAALELQVRSGIDW